MIRFERVSKRYGEGHDALREISFEIECDDLVFLTGHSGAGKSTLMRLIMLMDRPTRGKVEIDGRDLATVTNRQVPAHRERPARQPGHQRPLSAAAQCIAELAARIGGNRNVGKIVQMRIYQSPCRFQGPRKERGQRAGSRHQLDVIRRHQQPGSFDPGAQAGWVQKR